MILGTNRRRTVRFGGSAALRAYRLASEVFGPPFEIVDTETDSFLKFKDGEATRSVSFENEVSPSIAFASEYFGDIPEALIQKLRNQPVNTLFELKCMASFGKCHTVRYEPKLTSGKVADFAIRLSDTEEVLVECKSQGTVRSEIRFENCANEVLEIIRSARVRKIVWDNGFRIEVQFSKTPDSRELGTLRSTLSQASFRELTAGIELSGVTRISVVPRSQDFRKESAFLAGVMCVPTTPVPMHKEITESVVYGWPEIENALRRSQKGLLKEARCQLKGMPPQAKGMICIQTIGSRLFVPEVKILIEQPEFRQIPLVWINPFSTGRLVFRDDGAGTLEKVFGP